MSELSERYEKVCNEYAIQFCKQMDFEGMFGGWVAEEAGTIACIGDYFFDFHNVIKYAVDNALTDWHELLQWYDYCIDAYDLGLDKISFPSWHKGKPRASKETIDAFRRMRDDLNNLINEEKERLKGD